MYIPMSPKPQLSHTFMAPSKPLPTKAQPKAHLPTPLPARGSALQGGFQGTTLNPVICQATIAENMAAIDARIKELEAMKAGISNGQSLEFMKYLT